MTRLGIVFRPQFDSVLLRDTAVAADEAGVDELWLWEDCFEHGGIATTAAALAWTQRLEVGVGVLPVPLRNVALAAMEIASLHRMFPGRVHIGVGHGVLDWMGQVGARAESPMTLLREYLTALRELFAGDSVTTAGRYVQLRDVKLAWPVTPPPSLHVGAMRPKTLALAGELADGTVLTGGTPPEDVRSAREIFDAARGERPGRGRVTVYLIAVTGPDADARLVTELEHWGLQPGDGVAGDADAIAAEVQRWAEAGADAVILQPGPDVDPVQYARFGGEVRARLR